MTKKSSLQLSDQIIIYCGILDNNKVQSVVSFKGTKKQVLDFMNESYQRNEVICYFNNQTVFCFDEDINNLDNWKTVDQLTQQGIIELKEGKK